MNRLPAFCLVLFISVCIFSCGNRSPRQEQFHTEEPEETEQIVVPDGWESLLEYNSLGGWEIVRFGGEGEPFVKKGILTLPMAVNGTLTGVRWVGDSLPVNNYALTLEARRVSGNDFFVGITFPYNDSFASLILGGWGGATCGMSSIDGLNASENETTKFIYFKDNQWYPVKLYVTPDSIRATVDTVKLVNISTAGKEIHLRAGTSASAPLGLSSYITTGEIRNVFMKKLP